MENCGRNWLVLIGIIVVFILGLVFLLRTPSKKREGFENFSESSCPNLLIKKGEKIFLQNTSKATVPGVNPIEFSNLEEYVEFMDWLRGQGIRCPILYLEEEYDSQNNRGYAVKPDPWSSSKSDSKNKYYPSNEKEVYVDPSRAEQKMPSFDPMDQDIGKDNKIEQKFHSKAPVSASAIDPQWGGPDYSKEKVAEGKFEGSYVYKNPM